MRNKRLNKLRACAIALLLDAAAGPGNYNTGNESKLLSEYPSQRGEFFLR